ncbi:hypothetical protein [Conexibacter woesei]|nr:hypothetical protein [Conexibacter woesei]
MRILVALLAVGTLIALAGCGGDDKPAYCSDRSSLESSVKELANITRNTGLSGLRAQLGEVESDATALVDSAKSDFPEQTSAIRSSVDTLAGAVRSLQANPSAQQAATVATDAAAVVGYVSDFTSASSSECD